MNFTVHLVMKFLSCHILIFFSEVKMRGCNIMKCTVYKVYVGLVVLRQVHRFGLSVNTT